MNKKLAYLIGVYLGDGSTGSDKRTFCLQSIDRDFADKTADCLRNISDNQVRIVDVPRKTKRGKQVWAVYCSDVKLANMLNEITANRIHLPIDIEEWNKDLQWELISGLLDSEGYVSMSRIHMVSGFQVFDMKIGIGATDAWIYELHRLLQSHGIQVGVMFREKIKSGKIFGKFIFNKKSFIEHKLYFNIFRKQQRIENYKIMFPGSTTTRSIPRTDSFKRRLSEVAYGKERNLNGTFRGSDIV